MYAILSFPDQPTAVIKLGGPLVLDRIEEGHDIYFECKVHANPPANSILWRHNVRIRNIPMMGRFYIIRGGDFPLLRILTF